MKLELQSVSVSLSRKEILHGVSLTVQDGAFVSLLGPSGCGKSTLLKTVAGILPQTAGAVFLGGACADGLPPHLRGTTIVFQDTRLFPHMSAAENVAFPLRMRGVPRAARLREAEALLERVQLGGLGGRRPHALSGGQQQRVALARALAYRPNVLLLDEPFSGLDENLRGDMRALVRALHDEFGMTSVLVTHDGEEALSLSDAVVLMDEGHILQAGPPRTLYEHPADRRVAAYFGEACYVPGEVREGRFTSAVFSFPCGEADGPCTAVLRPHAFDAAQGGPFDLVEASYRGAGVAARFRHRASGLTLRAALPPDCGLRPEDPASLSVRPAAAAFLAGTSINI